MAVRVAVIGLGYVGLTTAACVAELGHPVTGYDVDVDRVQTLVNGRVPIAEPGLAELIGRHLGRKLRFTADLGAATACDLLFICVGTPATRSGAPDLSALEDVATTLVSRLRGDRWVVTKSTQHIKSHT